MAENAYNGIVVNTGLYPGAPTFLIHTLKS